MEAEKVKNYIKKWQDTFYDEIIDAGKAGKTVAEIASGIGVSEQTVYNWLIKIPSLKEEYTKAKDIYYTDKVEQSIIKRALGYSTTERTEQSASNTDITYTTIKTKDVPPDTDAAKFILKNRSPERWTEKQTDGTSIAAEIYNIIVENKQMSLQAGQTGKIHTHDGGHEDSTQAVSLTPEDTIYIPTLLSE